jgi:hypothetical protein
MRFLFGLAVTAAYWPGISGAATSPRWIIAAVVLPIAALHLPGPHRLTLAHAMGGAFVAWACASFIWSDYPDDTFGALFLLLVLTAAFQVGEALERKDMTNLWFGAAAGLFVSDAVAFAQLAGWEGPLAANVPAGLFINRNFYGEASALVFVALWDNPAFATALPGLLLTHARGGILGLAALIAPLWRIWRPASVALALMIAGGIAWISFGGSKMNSAADRFQIWGESLKLVDWHGHGFGVFRSIEPSIPTITYRWGHAYNEFIETAVELGWVGAALLGGFFAALLRGPLTRERLVFVALLIEACFDSPLHLPTTAILGTLAAGHLARDMSRARDAAWARRMALRGGVPDGVGCDRSSYYGPL